jgi:hypothetical protein
MNPMDGSSFVSVSKRPRGRPRKVPVSPPESNPLDPESVAALTQLEAMDNAPREQARAELEQLRDRLRAVHTPVPSVITQLRALGAVYRAELNRAAALPFGAYGIELGPNSIVHPLQTKISECQAILDGKAYADYEVPSVADQLARLSRQIEQIQLADVTLIDEICMTCARCEEWPARVVTLMQDIRELLARLTEARRRRGAGVVVHASGIPVDPRPETRPASHAITEFDPTNV